MRLFFRCCSANSITEFSDRYKHAGIIQLLLQYMNVILEARTLTNDLYECSIGPTDCCRYSMYNNNMACATRPARMSRFQRMSIKITIWFLFIFVNIIILLLLLLLLRCKHTGIRWEKKNTDLRTTGHVIWPYDAHSSRLALCCRNNFSDIYYIS